MANDVDIFGDTGGGSGDPDIFKDAPDTLKQPAGLSPKQIQEHAKKSQASFFRGEYPKLAFANDFLSQMTGLTRGAVNLAAKPFQEKGAEPLMPPNEMVSPGLTWGKGLGSVADPLALGIGGAAIKAIPYAQMFGKGVGGILGSIKGIVQNIAGGVTAGLPIGVLTSAGEGKDVVSGGAAGAVVGAGANLVLPGVMKALGSTAGRAWDLLSGRYGPLQAAKILNQSSGDDIAAIRAAMSSAPPNVTAAQAAAPINNDMISALGAYAAKSDTTNTYQRMYAQQAQDRIDRLARLAGGGNQTEAAQVRAASQDALNRITTPMREVELGAANIAGTTGARLQSEADRMAAAATNKVADVRNFEGLRNTADDLAQSGAVNLSRSSAPQTNIGMPRVGTGISYPSELAQRAGGASQQAADASLPLGEAARFAQARADSIAAHGLKPLDTNAIVSNIASKLRNPQIGVSDINRKVLTDVGEKIQEWTARNGGVIDANALYEIRKTAVNDAVERLLGTADPKTQAKRAASILQEVRPLIDEAIVKAGGTGWRNYLSTYEQGMRQIEQKELAAKALDYLKTSPKKLESLVAGDRPKDVKKIFSSDYDIQNVMAEKFPVLQGVSSELARDRALKEGALRGGEGFQGILSENYSKLHLPNVLQREVAVINKVMGEVETAINKNTANHLREAMKSGQNFMAAVNELPTAQRRTVMGIVSRAMTGTGNNPYIRGGILNSSQPYLNGVLSTQEVNQ